MGLVKWSHMILVMNYQPGCSQEVARAPWIPLPANNIPRDYSREFSHMGLVTWVQSWTINRVTHGK